MRGDRSRRAFQVLGSSAFLRDCWRASKNKTANTYIIEIAL
jgi:hypothetical protein